MKVLRTTFGSAAELVNHVRDVEDQGAIFVRTDDELRLDEEVLVEIDFPGLPHRALVRGAVSGFDALGAGAWVAFSPADASTRDFVLAVATGGITVSGKVPRRHPRFSADLPVSFKIPGGSEEQARAGDVGPGGTFVRTTTPPPVGTTVALRLGPAGNGELIVQGVVAWVQEDGDEPGMGVCFLDGPSPVVLRDLLQAASDRLAGRNVQARGQA